MISAENITKYYGAHAAVDNLSFTIDAHEVVGLLGHNGAGKTTTLRIVSGLLVPSSGTVKVDGLDMAQYPEQARSRIGFLPETPPLYVDMRVERFLRFVAKIHGLKDGMDEAVQRALEATDLVQVRDERIDTLSHGFRRRIGIAHVLVHRPSLILLDEPTSGLDPRQIVQMRALIRSLKETQTVIVSSHNLAEMHQLCDRILVMHEGKVVAEGTEDELASGVSRGTTVNLEVRGSEEQLVRCLSTLEQVSSHEVRPQGEEIVKATVELSGDHLESLAAAVVGQGLGLRRLEQADQGLENIFLQLTGRDGARAQERPHA